MHTYFYRLALLMGLFGILVGCDGDAPIKELPQRLLLESYLPNGELMARRTIASDDPVYQRLKSLLDAQSGGWKRSFASYRPAPFVLRDENIFIHCYADMMVIDVVRSGQSTSMKKRFPNLLQALGLP
ncbi:MAG: hypothetical protein PHX38_11160 [Sulfuricella sp.]|nr:hypothetical protein [Sulfuricella sp.]